MTNTYDEKAAQIWRQALVCSASDFCPHATFEGCIASAGAAALAACAREEAKELLPFAIHKTKCKGFPAFSEEQLARDCDCGLQAIKNRLAALDQAAGGKEKG